jgi:hypothetical protein
VAGPVTVVTLWSIPLKVQETPEASISMWEMLRGLANDEVSFPDSSIATTTIIMDI